MRQQICTTSESMELPPNCFHCIFSFWFEKKKWIWSMWSQQCNHLLAETRTGTCSRRKGFLQKNMFANNATSPGNILAQTILMELIHHHQKMSRSNTSPSWFRCHDRKIFPFFDETRLVPDCRKANSKRIFWHIVKFWTQNLSCVWILVHVTVKTVSSFHAMTTSIKTHGVAT